MELILWRHADAEEGADDLARRLSRKGEADAAAMAKWLRTQLPRDFALVSSPAVRAQQTAAALKAKVLTEAALAPGASVPAILGVIEKHLLDKGQGLVIVVGHQPDLGRAAAQLLANLRAEWHIEKGAIWWFSRGRIRAVLSPDLL
jgi:phosphohistidine phosphatase